MTLLAPPSLPARWCLGLVGLLGLLACQTDRAERRNAVEPSEPAPVLAPSSASTELDPLLPSASPAAVPAGKPLTRPPEPLNVILITVEAWRADMPWAGYARAMVPQLTQLVAQGVLWENHRAVSSHTPQSLAALSSGRLPSTLYRDGAAFPTYSAENVFLPELLQAKGIRTLGVQPDPQLARGKGFEQGFDVWESVARGSASETSSARAAGQLIDLLGQAPNTGKQFFAWLHLDDPGDPYVAPPQQASFGSSARDRYDGELQLVDTSVGKLLDFARQQSWWSRTAVIVTGDHGEAFGEHGMSQHGQQLWDVLLKTPLIIRAPGAQPARLGAARSQIDLAPTIVELMGLPRQEQHQGQSLLPELYGAPAAERPVLLFELCEDVQNPGLRALIAGDEKLLVPNRAADERLFNLKSDPGEERDLAESQSARLRALAVRFEGLWRDVPSIEPHGGMKLRSGGLARGPERPVRSP